MTDTFTCQHGRTHVERGDFHPDCEADVRALLPLIETMEDRGAALKQLVDAPLCVRFDTLHEVAEKLVGRPVWTHEFATGQFANLVAEATSQKHPADLEAHVIGSLDQAAGNKPVMVVRPE